MGLFSFGAKKEKSTTNQSQNTIESGSQSGSANTASTTTNTGVQNTSGATTSQGQSNTSQTGTSTNTGSASQVGNSASNTTQAGSQTEQQKSQLFSDEVLGGLEGAVKSLLGGIGGGAASTVVNQGLGSLGSFDPISYIANGMKSAQAQQQSFIDESLGGINDAIGGKNNSAAALLGQRVNSDAAAALAGTLNELTKGANAIVGQNVATAQGVASSSNDVLANLLSILKGGAAVTTGQTNTSGTTATTGSTSNVTNTSESGTTSNNAATNTAEQGTNTQQVTSQETQQLTQLITQLMNSLSNTNMTGTSSTKGTTLTAAGSFGGS